MIAQQEYHSNMRRSFTRMFLAAAALVSAAFAQGPPASVTSLGFGGNGNKGGGPPASVTSPGFGNTGQNRFFFNPPHQFHGNRNPKHHNFFAQNNFGAVYAVPVPYYVPLDTVEPVDDTMEQVTAPPAQYLGGPTVFDRRGPGVQLLLPSNRLPVSKLLLKQKPYQRLSQGRQQINRKPCWFSKTAITWQFRTTPS